jgi:hypothetical protein
MFRGREPWKGTDPVNKKLAAALSGGAVVLLALSGCSGGNDGKTDAWAKQFCVKYRPQSVKIAQANTSITQQSTDSTTPADVQQTDSTAYQTMADAYTALAAAVKGAGAPPVDNGAKAQRSVIKSFQTSAASYADLKKKVDALDTKDQSKFAEGLGEISGEVGTAATTGEKGLTTLETGDLGKAVDGQAACKPSPSPSGKGASPSA